MPGPFSFEGRHYSLVDLDAQPKPVQLPHPPLIMGGTAGPRSASLAGRFADEYNTVFPGLAAVRERKARIDRACEQAGREPIPFSVMTGVIVGIDADDLRERVARVSARSGADTVKLLAKPPEGWVVGTVEDAAEQLNNLADAGVSRVMCQHLAHEDLDFVALLGQELAPRVS
jgi:alkanesulfonate monooxygenase SsuD/methylene tetrahydromethanopterin reductase-like flavin-dependent oxidoreductase (luciferase family)